MLAGCASTALAQPVAGKSTPDRLNFGTVRVGARVEGSVRILARGNDTTGIAVRVQPPPFVRVTQTRTGTQTYGTAGTFVYCDVLISVNTSVAGEFDGRMTVEVGDQKVDVPVGAHVFEQEPGLTRILIVGTPFHRFSTSHAATFDPWLEIVRSSKLDVHYMEIDRAQAVLQTIEDLSNFDVVLLSGEGIYSARPTDFAQLKPFINSGGRVIVTANAFMLGTVDKANEFVVPYDLKMTDTEPSGGNSLIELEETEIPKHALTEGVRTLKFFRPSPVAVENFKSGKVLVQTQTDPQVGYVALANHGKGEIIALGISLWWNWIASPQETGADNARLLKNLLTKPRLAD
jgi:hypothetical protein